MVKSLIQQLNEMAKREAPKQPAKCVGCVWGRFEGTVQFCIKQKCVKDS